jgi:hypothetical protein
MLYSFATSSLVQKNDQTSYAVLRGIASGCAKNIQIRESFVRVAQLHKRIHGGTMRDRNLFRLPGHGVAVSRSAKPAATNT